MSQLEIVRLRILDLHRALLAVEREDYERLHGRVTGTAFLQALTGDPAFAWLRPLTSLIVTLDEMLEAAADLAESDRVDGIAHIRALLAPDENGNEFQRRYADALQQSPHVLLAHGAVVRAL
ncbi:MAG: hypothetical protein FD180_1679 [Planctomycetota bacterium]|nr:MAG: hypothetical protein FD180_1679 [Planctomycetota bacterium]